MAAGAALGAVFGEVFAVFHDSVKEVRSKALMFKPILKSLETQLDRLAPLVEDIRRLSEQLELPRVETETLIEHMKKGEKLVRKCSKIRWWYYLKVLYSTKLQELDKEIVKFCLVDLQVCGRRNDLKTLLSINRMLQKVDSVAESLETPRASCAVPGLRDLTVGLEMPIMELKTLLLKEEVQLLLVTAPGGCGKTTLVQKLCQDDQIKGIYKENILFVHVSKTPNVKRIVQNLFDHKHCRPEFLIRSDEEAIQQLPQLLNHIGLDPILLILDDVWLGSESLPEKFKFNIPKYKILVTSRTAFPRFEFTYHLKPLNDVDAMTLFRHSASLHDGSSYIPAEEDVKKIVRGCGGFPLIIQVIGGSLRRQQPVVWRSRLMNWSDGQFYSSYDTKLLAYFQKSLEFPNYMVIIKECFMDLCSFAKDQRIPLVALIDMWAELYKLDEDGIHATANLQELNIQNLASLVMATKDASGVKRYYNEDFVTQHVILRELAMHQISQESIEQRSRLIINISGNNLPNWWIEKEQQLINARLLSISTDELFSSSWCNIQGSKVEVLVLNFHTRNYTLPEFVEKMDKIKVLIINNNGFFHYKIRNIQLLRSLPNLKRIRLEKISISSLCKTLVPLKSLKKISLFMCNIGKAFENCTIQVSDAFPNLTEINIDYCNDLEELPVGLCDIVHLKKISITNCHKLFALPEETGKLVNLEMLRLRSCTNLSKLPNSIRNLHKLSILDISDCQSIVELPKHIGELCNLKEINMKGCLRLHQFPKSIMDLEQLKLVVCDKEWAKLWEPIKEFLSDLEVEVAEKESVNLFPQKLDSTIPSHPDFTVGLVEVAEKESVNLILQKVDSTICSPPDFAVGLDMPMKELKMLLLKEEVQLLFLISFGGFGKSTMGQMLCQEDKMKVVSVFFAYFILWKFFLREVVKEKRCNHHHLHSDHDISGISASPMEPLLLVNSLSHDDYMSVQSSLMEPLSHSDYMSVWSSFSLSSSSLPPPLPKPQALPLLELGIFRPKERSCSVDLLFPSPMTCPRREVEDRDRDRDQDSACSNSPIRSPLGAAMPPPSAPTSQPIAKSESVPASSDNSSLHSPLGAAMPSPPAPTPQPIAKSEFVPMISRWHKGKYIGSGAFGRVYRATNRETGALCAMKEVVLIPDDPKSEKRMMHLHKEIKFLSQLKHPNIVQYYGSERVKDRFYIYLEYVYPGSINNYVREHHKAITESVVRNFTRHILFGLAYLHSTRTIHRDIKGANLLVNSSGVVKLADFGLAKHLALQEAQHSSTGTARWMAPELTQCLECSSLDVALAVDIWSVGCTIIEMFTGKLPWGDLEVPAVCFKLYKGMSPPIPEKLSPVGKEFLSLCLKINPAERPSAARLLEHPFVKNSEQLDSNCLKINPAERPSAASLLEHPFVKNSEQLDSN